jgi:thiamine biosynthesis lipoprotein ApbE
MGTLLDCTLFDLPEVLGRDLLRQGMYEVRRLERLLSPYDADSALSRLNRQAGDGPVPVQQNSRGRRMAPSMWALGH